MMLQPHRTAPVAQAVRLRVRGQRHILPATRVGVAVVSFAAVAGLLPGGVIGPLAVALVVGLPHGAVDHVVLARRLGGRLGWAVGTVGYATAAAATFALAVITPLVIWTAFLILSVWHFGTADREALAAAGQRPSWWHAFAAGLIPVGGLMVVGAAELRPLAARLSPQIVALLDPGLVTVVGAVTASVTALALLVDVRAGRRRAAAELGLLVALVAAAPPLWAFGAYFGLWHAPRHVARMLEEEPPYADLSRHGGSLAAGRRFVRDAAAPTAIALTGGVVLVWLGRSADPVSVTAIALQVTAAVTFPHVATVALLDRLGPGATCPSDPA